MMYLRFVLLSRNADTGVQDGIFEHAYDLRHSVDLLEHESGELQDLLNWIEANLDVPSRFSRTQSKGYYRRHTKCVSWLKSSASAHIAKMQRIASILGDHGIDVSMIRSSRPGYVVYEDDHQIIAEPFKDSLRR